MITILDHPLVHHFLTELRDKNSNSPKFRRAAEIIGTNLAITAMENLRISECEVETPMEKTTGFRVDRDVVFVPVLRAGLALLEPFQRMYPDAVTGFIGMKRNEKTLEPDEYMFSFPQVSARTSVYVLDVMLATGGSLKATLARLQLEGVEDITVCCAIATPEGIENVLAEFKNINIITAALDRCLNDVGYILPGLGDAGDRFVGMA